MRSSRAIDSSYWKASSGARRRPTRAAMRRRRNGLARSRALAVVRSRRFVTEGRVVGARDLQVGADLHVSDGHEADAGVPDLPRQQVGQFLPDLFADAYRARPLHVYLSER